MPNKPLKFSLVDAFTESAFKGNPAAVVCMLEDNERDEQWMQSLATEFNLAETAFLTPLPDSSFRLRWFTPRVEVELCGHATLAAAHILFSSGLPISTSDLIEFHTLSGLLTAKKVTHQDASFIELDFPFDPILDVDDSNTTVDISQVSAALDGASIIDIKRTTIYQDILVVLASGEEVAKLKPDIEAIAKCPGGGIIATGIAPQGFGFDYYCRCFFPKAGINEDPITGSAQCAFAPYWSRKLGKSDLSAYAASARGGVAHIHVDEEKQRILLRGKAVTVMEGSVLI